MPLKPNIVPPPVYALAGACLMVFVARQFPQLSVTALVSPALKPFTTTLAVILITGGLAIDLSSLFRFIKRHTSFNPLRPENTRLLVCDGMYRFSRNPMYLGLLLVLAGIASYLANFAAFFVLPVFVVLINYVQIRPEEKVLEAKFGDSYRAYKLRVRRWI